MALIPRIQDQFNWWDPRKYEFGLSEKLSDVFGQGRTGQGGSNMFGDQSKTTLVPAGISASGQTKFAPMGQSGAYGNTLYNANNRPNYTAYNDTSPGGNTNTSTTNQNTNSTDGNTGFVDLAAMERASRLNAIRNNLNFIKDQVQRSIGEARGVRDEVVGNIGKTYSNLIKAAEGKRDTSLENLGQEEIDTQNTYGRAKGNARRATQSALLKNRLMARALNRLDSSFYEDRQHETNLEGARAQSQLGDEEAGKLAGIGTRKTEVKNWFEQQSANIEQERAQLESEAERDYQRQVNAALDTERGFSLDSVEQAEEAERTFASRLNQIREYIQGKASRIAEIAASAGNYDQSISSFEAVNPALARILSNMQGLNMAQKVIEGLPTFTNVTDSGQDIGFMRESKRDDYEERLRRFGLLA